jgi:hypothetical protein
MRVECLSVSKYHAPGKPGDDVPLILPGQCYAVFDGATDVNGTIINGAGGGRFAALQASIALTAEIAAHGPGALTQTDLIAAVNARLAAALSVQSEKQGKRITSATTMALMEVVGDIYRFTLVGDSGVRLNGTEVFQTLKPIDDIMSAGRVALYHHLKRQGGDHATLEALSRRGVFHGFDAAIPELISADEAVALVSEAERMLAGKLAPHYLAFADSLLRAGIAKGQYAYTNVPDHPLGYAVINGTTSQGFGITCFERPRDTVQSVEIFSDGYLDLPETVSMAAWEELAARIEREDPTKTLTYWGVKGSNPEQLFDDRTVIILSA